MKLKIQEKYAFIFKDGVQVQYFENFQEARECFSMEVRILCQSPGPFEPHTLIIKPKL